MYLVDSEVSLQQPLDSIVGHYGDITKAELLEYYPDLAEELIDSFRGFSISELGVKIHPKELDAAVRDFIGEG
ncbi:MAG: hypothetical protein Gyms2KO_03280 [Gymnodinialimonas sp.]